MQNDVHFVGSPVNFGRHNFVSFLLPLNFPAECCGFDDSCFPMNKRVNIVSSNKALASVRVDKHGEMREIVLSGVLRIRITPKFPFPWLPLPVAELFPDSELRIFWWCFSRVNLCDSSFGRFGCFPRRHL